MKPLTSWSRQDAARGKCPKRFYLSYLDRAGLAAPFRRLKSIRELGGQVVHAKLAEIVRNVANGARVSDHPTAGDEALRTFDQIVEDSQSLPAWTLSGQRQVAELHNGQNADEEIAHWREIIPICVENGLRVMSTMGFRSDAGERTMHAEEEIRFQKSGREHRCVIDVLLRDKNNRTVVDWKCHSISNTDVQQVHFYQDYLAKTEHIPHSRLYGFAVDLLHEEIMEANFRPHDPNRRSGHPRSQLIEKSANPYPARPAQENCTRCPFAAVCSESVIRPPQSICLLGGNP